jgi:hypothetical protein
MLQTQKKTICIVILLQKLKNVSPDDGRLIWEPVNISALSPLTEVMKAMSFNETIIQ